MNTIQKIKFNDMMWNMKGKSRVKKNNTNTNKITDFDYKKEHERIQELNKIYLNKIRNKEI